MYSAAHRGAVFARFAALVRPSRQQGRRDLLSDRPCPCNPVGHYARVKHLKIITPHHPHHLDDKPPPCPPTRPKQATFHCGNSAARARPQPTVPASLPSFSMFASVSLFVHTGLTAPPPLCSSHPLPHTRPASSACTMSAATAHPSPAATFFRLAQGQDALKNGHALIRGVNTELM